MHIVIATVFCTKFVFFYKSTLINMMSLSMDAKQDLFEKRLSKRLFLLTRIREVGTITEEEYDVNRQKIIAEEMQKIDKEDD